MTDRLKGDARRRALLDYWEQRDRRNELAGRIEMHKAALAEIKRTRDRSFDAYLRAMTAQEQISALSSDAAQAQCRAARLADQLGIDENPPTPARHRGPVKIGTRAARKVSVAPAKRTIPSGFMHRAILGPGRG
jgi:hypothetical protein